MKSGILALASVAAILAGPTTLVPADDVCSASSAYTTTAGLSNVVVHVTCPVALQSGAGEAAIRLTFNRSADAHRARLSGPGQLRCASDGGTIDCVGSVPDAGERADIYATIKPFTCANRATTTLTLRARTADGRILGPTKIAPPKRCPPTTPPHKPANLVVRTTAVPGGSRVSPTVSFSIGARTRVGVSIHRAGSSHPLVGRIVRCTHKGRWAVTLPSIDPAADGHRYVAEARGGGYVVRKAFRASSG